jgi:uncharacterized SAM-binding protein YcdF (DUF218 family)
MSFFFIISKIINTFLNPLVWIVILLIVGIALKNKNKARKFLIASLVSFLFFSNNFIIDVLIKAWEVPIVDQSEMKDCYDVAIVLGGGMINIDSENERMSFRHNTDRIMQAVDLYHKGKVDKILISGGAGHLIFRNVIEADLLVDFFSRNGVPDSVLIAENKSDNTYQNAVNSKLIVDSMEVSSVLLITSSLHMRRSRAIFIKQGFDFDIYPTNQLVGNLRYDPLYLLIPSPDALKRWDMLIHEVWGYCVYKVMGYL